MDEIRKDRGAGFLISQFEGGGLLSQPTLRELTGPFNVRAALQWMDLLLAALDCYNTFISLHIVQPQHVLSKFWSGDDSDPVIDLHKYLFTFHLPDSKDKSSFLKATHFFLTELAAHELTAAESCFSIGDKTSHFSPREVDQYNYSKCTIIVRLLEFASMILLKGDQGFWKVPMISFCYYLKKKKI